MDRTTKQKAAYWDSVLLEAYRSREKIKHWCTKNGISVKSFHYWSKKLGYTANGKRTAKYHTFMEGVRQSTSESVVPATPVFVEVSAQVLRQFSQPTSEIQASQPQIIIQAGKYQIGIRDGFSEQTLSKVLEVVRYA